MTRAGGPGLCHLIGPVLPGAMASRASLHGESVGVSDADSPQPLKCPAVSAQA